MGIAKSASAIATAICHPNGNRHNANARKKPGIEPIVPGANGAISDNPNPVAGKVTTGE